MSVDGLAILLLAVPAVAVVFFILSFVGLGKDAASDVWTRRLIVMGWVTVGLIACAIAVLFWTGRNTAEEFAAVFMLVILLCASLFAVAGRWNPRARAILLFVLNAGMAGGCFTSGLVRGGLIGSLLMGAGVLMALGLATALIATIRRLRAGRYFSGNIAP